MDNRLMTAVTITTWLVEWAWHVPHGWSALADTARGMAKSLIDVF
jgi:hypothetical protein